jgi:hypothetical protein
VVFGHNEHEIDHARRLARRLGMRFVVRFSKTAWRPAFAATG